MGLDIQRLRRGVAFDRLLARLFHENDTMWALKGGYAMELRLQQARATRDMDFSVRKAQSRQGLWGLLQEKAGWDLQDFFVFQVGPPGRDIEGAPEGGARFAVEARVDGRTFASFHLDVGMGDVFLKPLDTVEGKDWLTFAGIPAPRIYMVAREQQFADKLHAFTRPRQTPNSRVRDIVDMLLLIKSGKMKRTRVAEAVKSVFGQRNTHPPPGTLSAPSDRWETSYAALARDCRLEENLDEAFQKLGRYYDALNISGTL